ncbi:protoporphyrinogen oxidase [Agromyces archimandritae]|uniref:Coproporphyrinogen III oxidase n=1 Tax=Agromyces archimandritae TaxID=2781962 RepID=A0A975FJ36_9MICO|nr:protoporphyrinogen oxidase [Agromyces archimandritae]QTX03438.1 protoporphyrinogen oxidase [Agromyces archimandritae]
MSRASLPASVDLVVAGGGVAGLVAAVDAAHAGASVALLEASDRFGGCVGRVRLGGLTLDSGAESFALRGDVVQPYLEELGLGAEIVDPRPGGSSLAFRDADGALGVRRMPKTGLLGIPADPLAGDVVALIGAEAAERAAALDARPLELPEEPTALGALVRGRMGDEVLTRLVAPISSGVYSTDPDVLDVDAVAPGLPAAVREAGALGPAVGRLLAARRAGSAVRGLRGGMHTLVDALVAEARRLGVVLVPGTAVTRLDRAGTGIRASAGSAGTVSARAVVLAAPAAASRALLAGLAEPAASTPFTEPWPEPASVELAILAVDAPALDAAPRGTGLLVSRDAPGVTAKALTHVSAKWPWLAEALPAGRHIVRLSYGRAGEANPAADLDDDAFTALALADASALLGVRLDTAVDAARVRWRDALSHAALGQRDRVDRLELALAAMPAAVPAIGATGSWLAGTGLASVIPHARAAAARALAALG